jgi:hypothetical protein
MKVAVRRALTVLLIAGGSAACVDSPASEALAPNTANNPLATSFDALAQDQMHANDVERSEEFRWAALALRAGVTPSVLQVTNEGKAEVYDAFVHGVTWASLTQALRPPSHRSVVAWRRTGDVLQVLLIGMFTDSALVLHPFSMRPDRPGDLTQSPVAGATAAYFERGIGGSSWIGIGGVAKVAEHPQPSNCAPPADEHRPSGVTCQLTRYGVGLNVLLARTRNRDSRDVDLNTATRRIVVPNQTVAGVKLVFACAMPMSTGC